MPSKHYIQFSKNLLKARLAQLWNIYMYIFSLAYHQALV